MASSEEFNNIDKPSYSIDKEKEAKLAELLPAIYSKLLDEPVDYHKFPTEAKLWCRWAWWTGKYSIDELAEHINVTSRMIRRWVHGHYKTPGWAADKEKADKRALQGTVLSNTVRMDKVLTKVLDALERTASDILDENRKLTVQEFNMMTTAFEKVHRVRQLEMGRPTEILVGADGKSMTWTDIRKELEAVEVDNLLVE